MPKALEGRGAPEHAGDEPTSGKTAACRDQEEQLEVMPGRSPLGVMPSLEGEDAAGGTGMTASYVPTFQRSSSMQPLPPAACDVAAKAALQGFCSMPKPLPAGARPRPASCHIATACLQTIENFSISQ